MTTPNDAMTTVRAWVDRQPDEVWCSCHGTPSRGSIHVFAHEFSASCTCCRDRCLGTGKFPNTRKAAVLAMVKVPCNHRYHDDGGRVMSGDIPCSKCGIFAEWNREESCWILKRGMMSFNLDAWLDDAPEGVREGQELKYWQQVAEAAGWVLWHGFQEWHVSTLEGGISGETIASASTPREAIVAAFSEGQE